MRGYLWCTAAKGAGVRAAHERNNPRIQAMRLIFSLSFRVK